MAQERVAFPVRHFTEPSLPHVCAWTGEPATEWEAITVKNRIGAQWWLLLLGIFPLVIVRAVTVKQVTGYLPVATAVRAERQGTARRTWGVDDAPSIFITGFALLLIVYSLIGGNESIFLATFIGLPFLLLGIVALIDRRRRAPVVGPGFVTPEIGLDRHGGIITVLRASPQFVSAARELARPQIQPVPDASPGTVQATSPPNGFGGATPAAHAPPSQEAPAGTGTAPGTPSWPLPAAERATDAPPPWWSS